MAALNFNSFIQRRWLIYITILLLIIYFGVSLSPLTFHLRNDQKVSYSPNDNQVIVFPNESPLIRRYLDTVRDTVCGLTLRTRERAVVGDVENITKLDIDKRIKGLDWPLIGITMIGQSRLKNLEWALRFVIGNRIPGDFIECGVWRGGSSLYARAILQAFDITDRHVWLADSFEGLPKARTKNDRDFWSKQEYLKVNGSFFFSRSFYFRLI